MAGHSRALALDDVAEDLGGELLALVVTDDTDLNLLVVAEILVVVHLAGHEGIGTGCDGVGQEKVACSTAERHLGKRPLQQLVGHNALHAKLPLEQADEVGSRHGLRQCAHDPASTEDISHGARLQELHLCEAHFLGNLIVDAPHSIVHVGVHGHDGDAPPYGLHHALLHIVGSDDSFQGMEDQGMVRHDEIAVETYGLTDDVGCNVETL